MSLQEINDLAKTMEKISKMPIYIDDTPILSLLDIRTKLLKIFNEKTPNGIVIIDYLQLMTLNMKLENRVQEISYITRNLKLMAKEFNIPILLLSQLSRNVESRVKKRPMLSYLRES
jgi:replicative DNA helicase